MDFVYEIENNLPPEVCEEIISKYKNDQRKVDGGLGNHGTVNKHIRSSSVLNLSGLQEWKEIDKILYNSLSEGLKQYKTYISVYGPGHNIIEDGLLTKTDGLLNNLRDEGYTIQEMKRGDFYTWHYDTAFEPLNRQITAIWYLNTLEECDGGTTDFWMGRQIKPKQGTLLFFPSTWSYIHRGSPIKSDNTKYTCITWLGV
jgi:Rps23 Pro-64 3,4-dihydroxylase Tpa1-like proline 4-hydroxylase